MKITTIILAIGVMYSRPLLAQSECTPSRAGVIAVRGVPKPFDIDTAAWSSLPQLRLKERVGKGETGTYEGARLSEILRRGGIELGAALHGGGVAQTVFVVGADGYSAAFGIAEIDTSIVDNTVIIARRLNAANLAAKFGPYQAIVTRDKRQMRWVRGVSCIRLYRP